MTATRAPIALLTDFGERDAYVGAMKGALLSRLPGATLVDISHAIPPGRIAHGGFVLEEATPHFPAGTVFLVVVDPGVGTTRRPLAVLSGERYFVGPDNGVFSAALAVPGAAAREIEPSRVGVHSVSRTFHGRDLFAPAAAYLAGGGAFERVGPAAAGAVRLAVPVARRDGDALHGEIVHVDRFGNCITSVRSGDLDAWRSDTGPGNFVVRCGGASLAGLVETYGDAAPDAPCALVGSSGRLEIAVRDGDAASSLGVREGDPVRIEKQRAGALAGSSDQRLRRAAPDDSSSRRSLCGAAPTGSI